MSRQTVGFAVLLEIVEELDGTCGYPVQLDLQPILSSRPECASQLGRKVLVPDVR